jgi:ATP-binding cassette subfamily F protein 3
VADEYALLSEDFRNRGGYEFRANIKAVLNGLDFGEDYYHRVVDTLSGGQKTRLSLARLLVARPDLLILDEPTNHLDMETLAWVEKYLQSYSGAILVVSHDRYFLDTLVEAVYEIDRGRLRRYTGNYSRFVRLREEQARIEARQYSKQQEEIARAEDFIRRNIARASTTGRAQSRRKALEKIDPLEKPREMKSVRFSFTAGRPGSREVLVASNLSVGYGRHTLARGIDLMIERGDRIALVGPNGAGKSTLLKTLAGVLRPLGGHIVLGNNVSIGYYDQEQAGMAGSHTVLDEIWNRFPHMEEKDVRGLLGNFLFSGDDVFKTVDQLSGGERSRLALARLMMRRDNFLLLDEPTNHLDVYSREVLEEALDGYDGTILLVSHDRYFLNRLARKMIEITPSGLVCCSGNYDDYLAGRNSQAGAGSPGPSPEKQQARLLYRQEKEAQRLKEKKMRQLSDLEAAIGDTEARIASLEEETNSPGVYQNLNLLLQKNAELEKERASLDSLYSRWESLMTELDRG